MLGNRSSGSAGAGGQVGQEQRLGVLNLTRWTDFDDDDVLDRDGIETTLDYLPWQCAC